MENSNDLPFPEVEDGVNIPLFYKKSDKYTKENISESATAAMKSIVDEGINDPLEVYTKLKTIQEFVSKCVEEIKDSALDELDKYGKEGAKIFGIPLIQKNSGKKLTYDHYSDWCDIDDEIKALTEKRKDLESKMKASIGTAGMVNDETGEIIPPAVLASAGKTIIQATIPKN